MAGTVERRRPRGLRSGILTAARKHEVLMIAESLRLTWHETEVIKDRRYHLRNYPRCFVGRDVVDWLLEKGEADTRQQAVNIMRNVEEYNIIHHVVDDHVFKDEYLFYRFRRDDGTYEDEPSVDDLAAGQRLYSRLCASQQKLIQDRKYHGRTYHSCVIGSELVDFLITESLYSTRREAVAHLRDLVEAGVLHHVCNDHHFKDDYLFYRFLNDEKRNPTKKSGDAGSSHGRGNRPSSESRASVSSMLSTQSTEGDSPRHLSSSSSYSSESGPGRAGLMSSNGIGRSPDARPHLPPSVSLPIANARGQHASVTAAGTPPEFIYQVTVEELLEPDSGFIRHHVCVVSDPVGFGFVIRGVSPVHVHTVDPTGPAAASGLKVGDFLVSVNGQDVLRSTHVDVAKLIVRGSAIANLVVLTHPALS